MATYQIIRHHFDRKNETTRTGLTLEEAQEHCNDPETSSRTCGEDTATTNPGVWFDGYGEE